MIVNSHNSTRQMIKLLLLTILIGFLAACTESTTTPVVEEVKPPLPQPSEAEKDIMADACSAPQEAIALYDKYHLAVGLKEVEYLLTIGLIYDLCLKDMDGALPWYEKASDAGDVDGGLYAGMEYIKRGEVELGKQWLKRSSDLKNILATNQLAIMAYEDKDYNQANHYYLLTLDYVRQGVYADNEELYRANYYLGELNYHQFKDYKKAYEYYGKAQTLPYRYNISPSKLTTQAFYGMVNARVRGGFIEEDDDGFSFDDLMVYIQLDRDRGFAFANKADLFSLARNLQQNGDDIRAMGIYYSTIAFGLVTLEEVNAELKATGLNITRAQKEQAKEWQNKAFAGIYSFKPHLYTGELE